MSSIPMSIRSGRNRDQAEQRERNDPVADNDNGVLVSRIVAFPSTIGGIADDTDMPANAAIQSQVSSPTIRPNSSVLMTSSGCSAAANSCANGLPTGTLTSASRKIPAKLSGSIHRWLNESPSAKV